MNHSKYKAVPTPAYIVMRWHLSAIGDSSRNNGLTFISAWFTDLWPGVIWFSAAGAHEEVKTLVSESCREKPITEGNSLMEWWAVGWDNRYTTVCIRLTLTSSLQSSGAQSSRVFLQATRGQATHRHTSYITAAWLQDLLVSLTIKYTEQGVLWLEWCKLNLEALVYLQSHNSDDAWNSVSQH